MVIELKPIKKEDVEKELDANALRILLKSIELLGGPKKLIEHRNLTWLPSLLLASYAILLYENGKTKEEIAEYLGTTKSTVNNILSSDPEKVFMRINLNEKDEERRHHVAGGIAKKAYEEIKAGNDATLVQLLISIDVLENIGVPWAVIVLKAVKGQDFPLTKDAFLSSLGDLEIKGKKLKDVADKIEFPVKSPSELLKKLKTVLEVS